MKHKTGKLLSILLALLFVVTLMPTTALATNGVFFEREDGSESFGGTIEVGETVSVSYEGFDTQEDSFRWYRMVPVSPGASDYKYEYLDDDYCYFNETYTAREEDIGCRIGCEIFSYAIGQAETDLLTVIKAPEQVKSVKVTLEVPYDGLTPDDVSYEYWIHGGFTLDIKWYEYDSNGYPGVMQGDQPFKEGKKYDAVLFFIEDDGYRMSEETTMIVNEKNYGKLTYDYMGDTYTGELSFVCEGDPAKLLREATVKLNKIPSDGDARDDTTVVVDKKAPYEVRSVVRQSGDTYEKAEAWGGTKFEGGKTYWYDVTLVPKESGKKFAAPITFTQSALVVKGSGTAADPVVNQDGSLTVTLKFTVEQKENTVTVEGGTANPAKAAKGKKITLAANGNTAEQQFDRWIVKEGEVKFADETDPNTTFMMPGTPVTVRAIYNSASKAVITFKIEGGTWDGSYAGDKTVVIPLLNSKGTLKAGIVPKDMQANEGYEGGKWDVEPVTSQDGITGNVVYTYSFTKTAGAEDETETTESGSKIPVLWIVIGAVVVAAAVIIGIVIGKKKGSGPKPEAPKPEEKPEAPKPEDPKPEEKPEDENK